MRGLVDGRVVPALPRILEAAQAHRPTVDSAGVRLDDYSDAVRNLLELVRSDFFGQWPAERVEELTRRMAAAVETQNGREVGKVFKEVLGVDLFKAEPWLNGEVEAFVTANVSLIQSLSSSYFDRIEQTVLTAARTGLSWHEVAGDLRSAYGASRARAELIARDQIGKFNGQLSMLRQSGAGVTRYTWRTARDERVRASHRRMEGRVCLWSERPLVGSRHVHPGEDFQCRCYAEPVLEDLLDGDD